MKKLLKLISIIAIFSFIVSLLVLEASAATTGSCGENLTYSIENGVCTISGTGKMYDYKSSGNLRSPFYSNRKNITSIVIEEGVTSVGNYAFYTCEYMTSITFASSVTSIGEYAFFRCYGLESITFPDTVRSLGQRTFSTCTGLKNVTFEGFVGYMGANIFDGATAVESVTFEKLSAPMTYWSSSWNTNLNSTATVTWGDETYTNPSYTDGLQFTHSNGSVVVSGYTGSSSTVNIPSEYNAIPIKIIDKHAFSNNKTVEEIVLPETITTIRQGAFMGAENLSSVNIPSSLKNVEMRAFANCDSLGITEYNNGYYLGNGSNNYYILCGIKDTSVSSFTVHKDTKIVQGELFYNCINLTEINVPSENTNYKSVDGVLFSYDGKTLYAYPNEKTESTYTVPSDVVTINQSAFYGNTNLLSVTISNTVENINAYAFANCTHLSDITLSTSLSKIRAYAFYNCVSLKTVTIPSSVTEIVSGAFSGCVNLVEVINKSSLTVVAGNDSNGSVALYAKVVSTAASNQITTDANGFVFFNDGTTAELIGYTGAGGNIVLPADSNGLPYSIAEFAFAYNSDITEITITSGVTSIGDYAFAGCVNLTSATVGECVLTIGLGAFENCNSLYEITLPFIGKSASDKTFIGYVFGASGYNTQNGALPASLKTVMITGSADILSNAFYGCAGIEKIIISEDVANIGANAFNGCTGLSYNIFANGKYIGSDSSDYFVFVDLLDTSVVSLEINAGTKFILNDAINGATNLQSITLSGTSAYYTSIDGVLVNTLYNRIVCYPSAKTGSSYTIPESVTAIGAYAFAGNKNLTQIILHENVTSIGTYAFYDCDGLTSFTVPETVTNVELGILHGCDNIETLTLHKLKDFGDHLGYYFGTKYYKRNNEFVPKSLKTVVLTAETEISDFAFYDCRRLENVILPEGLTAIGKHAFTDCFYLYEIELPSTLQKIDYAAFKGCTALKTLTIPSSVTEIGVSAFNGCSLLESIELPYVGLKESYSSTSLRNTFGVIFGTSVYDGGYLARQNFMNSNSDKYVGNWYVPLSLKNVTVNGGNINYGTFMNLKSVENLNFVKDVNFVDESAISALVFSGCSGLKNINIEDGNAKYASVSGILFTPDKTGLLLCPVKKVDSELKLPSTLTSIPSGAFANCTNLTIIEIPDSVKSIGSGAFKGCTSLVTIKLPFVGSAPLTESDYDDKYLFGYVFGTGTIDGCTSVYQEISSNKNGTYAIPNSLKTVIITGNSGGTYINIAAFYNCTMLENIVIGSGVTTVGNNAFKGCTNATVYIESASGVIGAYSNPDNIPVVYDAVVDDFFTSVVEKVTVSFAGDGVSIESIQTTGAVELPLATDVTVPEGKMLSGWNDGTNTYLPGETVYVSENVTFTAVYGNVYTVNYTGEGVNLSSVSTTGAVTLPSASDITVPTDKGFLGWSDGETTYAGGESVTVAKNTTFTVVYEQLYFVSYAGDGVDIDSVYVNGSMTLPAAPEREGYTFEGWSDGTTVFNAGASVTISKNTTFTAVWNKALQEVNLLPDVCELNATTSSSFPTLEDLTTASGVTYSDMVNNGNKLRGQTSYLELRNRGDTPWTDQYLTWGGYALNNASAQLKVSTCFYIAGTAAADMSFFIGNDTIMSLSSAVVTLGGVEKGSVSTATQLELSVVIDDPSAANPTAVITLGDYTETITLSAPIETLTFGYVVDFNNSQTATRIYYVRAKQYV